MTSAIRSAVHAMAEHGNGGRGGRSNVRTALILLSIAVVFFLGIVLKFWLFG